MPARSPKNFSAMYPPRLSPTMSTAISHISRGLKTAYGPNVASGSTGSTTSASSTSCMTARSSPSPRRPTSAVQLGLEVEQHRDRAAQHHRDRAIAEHGVGAERVHQQQGDLGGDAGVGSGLAQARGVAHRGRGGHADEARGQDPAAVPAERSAQTAPSSVTSGNVRSPASGEAVLSRCRPTIRPRPSAMPRSPRTSVSGGTLPLRAPRHGRVPFVQTCSGPRPIRRVDEAGGSRPRPCSRLPA